MMYLLSNFAGWLIAAFLVGALVSLFTCRGRGPCPGWMVALALFLVGLVLAVLKLLPGRAGLLLDTALLFAAAYAIGCMLGCWLSSLMGTGAKADAAATGPAPAAPALLSSPRGGGADDLRLIQGVGPEEEKTLNAKGVHHYDQVANWDAGNTAWASNLFGAPGRVEAEQWVSQAKVLAAGRDTDYSVLLRAARKRAAEGLGASGAAAAAASAVAAATPSASAGANAPSAGLPLGPGGQVWQATQAAAPVTPVTQPTVASAPKAAAPVEAKPAAQATAAASQPYASPGLPLTPDGAVWQAEGAASSATASSGASAASSGLSARDAGAGAAATLLPLAPTGAVWGAAHAAPVAAVMQATTPVAAATPAVPAASAPQSAVAEPAAPYASPGLPLAPTGAVWARVEDGPPAPRIEGEENYEGSRPTGLLGPRGGKADDLKHIKGIGPQNEGRLHGLGVWHFDQIAAWTHENVLWVGSYLAFPGRIDRENWVEQAKLLAKGVETEFSKRAAAGLVPTSKDDGSLGQSNVQKVEKKDQ